MIRRMLPIAFVLLCLSVFSPLVSLAQFTNDEYRKALWMATRFYGAQRSGDNDNWLLQDHQVNNNGKQRNGKDFINDSDGGYDLSGGWHDCGDHVKFGQTQFYSAYVLLLGYEAWPTGYDDYYSPDYAGYHQAQDYSWEGAKGIPNGIPDILDEVRYATDYFIKCARNGSTFYSQVGDGDYDHKQWVTSSFMSTLSVNNGGETRPVKKNPNDASMASFCGATLALMSQHYRKFDPDYADLCLQHAEYCYTYAASKKTSGGASQPFYGSDKDWRDNYYCLLVELYLATGKSSYWSEASSYRQNDINYWVLDYENSKDLAYYAQYRGGQSAGATGLGKCSDNYKTKKNGSDLIVAGGTWGRLRYGANAAFVVALDQTVSNESTIWSGVSGTVDYILGDNGANQSFMVGFGNKSPQKPHHRNVYLSDANKIGNHLTIPTRNKQLGMLVGGHSNPSSYLDDISTFSQTEGCIDYQAGLVGALAYMVSKNDPVDTSKFNPGVGFDEKIANGGVQVFPNPSSETVHLRVNHPHLSVAYVTITDVAGYPKVHQPWSTADLQEIDITGWSPGIYMVELTSLKGEKGWLKFAKN